MVLLTLFILDNALISQGESARTDAGEQCTNLIDSGANRTL